jgi:hypothetical protein
MLGAGVMTRQGGVYLYGRVPIASDKRTIRTRQRMAARTSDGITDQFSPGRGDNQQVVQLTTDYATVQFDLGCVFRHVTFRVGQISPGQKGSARCRPGIVDLVILWF